MTAAARGSGDRGWYRALIGVATGALVAGLVVPFASDQSPDAVQAGRGPGASAAATSPGDTGDSTNAGIGAVGAGEAAGSGPTVSGPTGVSAGTDTAAPRRAAGPSGSGTDTSGSSAPASTAGATEQGVTADAIELGIMIFDLGGISRVGVTVPGTDPKQQREWWDAWVKDLNARGGVHGRRVEPSYYQYDVLSQDSMRAACLKATADDGMFAALDTGSFGPGSALCFTHEHGTPLLSLGSTGFSERDFAMSDGLLFSMFADGRRMMANLVWELHQLGRLRTKTATGQHAPRTIGILSSELPGGRETVERGVVATLEELGYEVTHWEELSSDPSTSAGQIPVAVNQMRSKGVDGLILLAGITGSTQFVQQADGQGYRPSYFATDWQAAWSETFVGNMPSNWDGTLITTSRTGERHAGIPDNAHAEECFAVFERYAGRSIDRSPESKEHWSSLLTCNLFKVFELGAKAAGPELTRRSFSDGLQSLGEIPMTVFGGGSLRRGKFGMADLVRTARFDPGCDCWLPADDFRRSRE